MDPPVHPPPPQREGSCSHNHSVDAPWKECQGTLADLCCLVREPAEKVPAAAMVLLLGLVNPSCLAWGHCGRRLVPPSFLRVASASDIFGLQENCALGSFTYSEVLALWLEERQTDLPWISLHCTAVASVSASGSTR